MITNESLSSLPKNEQGEYFFEFRVFLSSPDDAEETQDDLDAAFAEEFSDEVEIPEYVFFEKLVDLQDGNFVYKATFSA